MKTLLQRTLLCALLLTEALFANIQTLNAQTSLHDSLRNILSYVHQNVNDEKIKTEIDSVQNLFGTNTINDSLAIKLLAIEDLLSNTGQLSKQVKLSYAEFLSEFLSELTPSKKHPAYLASLEKLGGLYEIIGQYDKALSYYQQVLSVRKNTVGEEHPDYARILNAEGDLYRYMGEYEKALPLLQQSLEIRKKISGEKSADYATSLNSEGDLYRDMGKFKEALPLYQQALAIRKKVLGGTHPDYATTLNSMGVLYESLGEYEKAICSYEQSLAIRKKTLGEEHFEYCNTLSNIASLYETMGKYEKALPLFQELIAIRKKVLGEEHPDYAFSLNDLAVLYRSMGEYDRALPLFLQSLNILKKVFGEDQIDYANSLNNLAGLYKRMGQYNLALPLYEQVINIVRNVLGEQHPNYAITLNNLADLYERMGEYEKALPLFQQTLDMKRKELGEEHLYYANGLSNLAGLYTDMGQYDKALSLEKKVVAIRKKALGEDNIEYAMSLNSLASIYDHMGEYQNAIPLTRKALSIIKKRAGEEHPDYISSLNNLANLYFHLQDDKQSLTLYQQSLTITKKVLGEQHPDYATSLNNLASVYQRLNDYKHALALCQQALKIQKKILGDKHPDYITSLNNSGVLYNLSGNYEEGQALLVEANNIELEHLDKIYSTLSENEKITYLQKESFQFDYLPSISLPQRTIRSKAIKQIYVNELVLKSMVLEDQQQILSNIRRSNDTALLELYNQWSFNKAFLGKQLLLPLSKRIPYLDSLQEATDQLEQQLSRSSATFRTQQQNQTITTTDISNKLTNGEAAIEFIKFQLYNKKWTDSTIYAALLLLPGDSIPKFVSLFEEKKLQYLLQNATISQFYPAANNSSGFSLAKRKSLYDLVWKPLEKYLTGVNTIYYSPTGLLHRIAFNALSYDTSHLLIDKYKLNQVLSTRSVVLPTYTFQPSSVSLWGNIKYDFQRNVTDSQLYATARGLDTITSTFNFYASDTRGSRGTTFSKLPGTKSEMDSINTVCINAGIQIVNVSDTVATEEAFKALDGKSPQILHLATHGFFLPVKESKSKTGSNTSSAENVFSVQQNPMFRSGLVLAGANSTWKGEIIPGRKEDGILTAYEIAQMDLSRTDLVVLSACNTALGDLKGNEGVIGLQRAFKLAGVKQMILSLWNVPDQQTVELMTMFYRNLINHESTKEALRNAQLKMKEKYPPYYWAAFVVVE